MRIRLKQSIIGCKQGDETKRFLHAEKNDVLQVIFRNDTHFVCDSKNYPDRGIIVFNSQCNIIDRAGEDIVEDPHAEEKYYHVYEDQSNLKLDDPFHTAFEFDDPQ